VSVSILPFPIIIGDLFRFFFDLAVRINIVVLFANVLVIYVIYKKILN